MTRAGRVEKVRAETVRVIKLGGSLLEWPELASRLRAWLAVQPPAVNVMIVGGGALVDKLRELDTAHALPTEASHWLAIRAMSITAGVVAGLVPEAKLVDAIECLDLFGTGPLQILDAQYFLNQEHGTADALPASWGVTSDSIAARVAAVLGANELVLLKSSLPADAIDLESLARAGYVDAYFPHAAKSLLVRCVNLRSGVFSDVTVGQAKKC
jgi:aspartokinase-like uncharacterized kinase